MLGGLDAEEPEQLQLPMPRSTVPLGSGINYFSVVCLLRGCVSRLWASDELWISCKKGMGWVGSSTHAKLRQDLGSASQCLRCLPTAPAPSRTTSPCLQPGARRSGEFPAGRQVVPSSAEGRPLQL